MANKKDATIEGSSVLDRLIEDGEGGEAIDALGIPAIHNVPMPVSVILGSAKMTVQALVSLSRGSVIELDKKIGEPVSLMVNDTLIARGSLVQVGENGLGVTLTEIARDLKSIV